MIETKHQRAVDAWVEKHAQSYLDSGRILAEMASLNQHQVSGLRSVASSARTFAEIEDWLLGQIGRSQEGKKWRVCLSEAPKGVGNRLLDELRALRREAEAIAPERWPGVALKLAQAWARRIDASYRYCAKARED